MARTTRKTFLALILAITILLYYTHHLPSSSHITVLTPANATAGFGTILAVSRPHSRRRPGLLWAANLTDLDIIIPPQPSWSVDDPALLRPDPDSAISEGSARAWLGHLHALQQFLDTGMETALIVEDDVGFDLAIRTVQIPLLASSLRSLLSTASPPPSTAYWPHPSTWDLLYPGHCDDALPSPSNPLLSHPHLTYPDPTTPSTSLLHPDTAHFLHALRVPPGTRLLHRALAPFCTFAYAVMRASAARTVGEYATPKEGASAFDVQLLLGCREEMRCFSVAPEVFHHGDDASEIAGVDGFEVGGRRSGKGPWNVRCGARHGWLWVEEGDERGREEARGLVREMLRRGGEECPIEVWRAERSWRGCEWGDCGAQS
ncbi:glycosyltransferase family 25-like protein [Stagonosporopsis vannaccii]|nr:glycosyltransferase family 25-like protein [Stagonosporopsis vannaccii]